jgi:ferrous iron transport protein B
MQQLVVGLLVVLCSIYALWSLMPAALRRPLAGWLLRMPGIGPCGPLASVLRRAAAGPNACGCDGCDAKPAAPKRADAAVPIRILRKPGKR